MPARKVGGQKQRQAPGKWERMTNKQQRRLVRAYDAWSTKVRKLLFNASNRGASISDQSALLSRYLPELETTMLEITNKGIEQAVRAEAGDKANLPPVRAVVQRQIAENNRLVKEALIPRIHEKLIEHIARGEAMDKKVLAASFTPLRSAAAAYAGGAWVMIFTLQQAMGKLRETERRVQGLAIEPVRWVLDKAAEHCEDSPGHYGCRGLAGVYPGGWNTLKTVPAGSLVTCRGNCRCHLEVKVDGKWKRGL